MRTRKLDVRGLQYHVQEWGADGNPKLFMLHGWKDCGASFAYMAPYLAERFHLIAPDLRGFGETGHAPNGYWYPDYFADLEVLLEHYAPREQVDLVGHSMGGNIVLMYAGIRPQRVKRVLSLEGIGIPASEPKDTVVRYRKWLDQIGRVEETKVYPNAELLKRSIQRGNPSLPDKVIEDLAKLWGRPLPDDDGGAMMLKHDQRHRQINPVRYNFDDVQEIWRLVTAKVGLVMATDSRIYNEFAVKGRLDQAVDALRIMPEHLYLMEDCDHMMHLQQPEKTANLILDFFA